MSWKDGVCWIIILIGVFSFLYGANYYHGLMGWFGVSLLVTGFLAKLIVTIWTTLERN